MYEKAEIARMMLKSGQCVCCKVMSGSVLVL